MCEFIVEARCEHCVHVVARYERVRAHIEARCEHTSACVYTCVEARCEHVCVHVEASLQGAPLLFSPVFF